MPFMSVKVIRAALLAILVTSSFVVTSAEPGLKDKQSLSDSGVTSLWIGFGCMMFSAVVFYIKALGVEEDKRLFHYITCLITSIAAIAYLAMATRHGDTLTYSADDIGNARQILYARYVDWTITTPLLLADLGFLAGVGKSQLFFIIMCDIIMCVTGLMGALIHGSDKWGFFILGCVFFVPILEALLRGFVDKAERASNEIGAKFKTLAYLTIGLWTLYPVIWILAEGTQAISVDTEVILYTITDVCAKCGFGFILLSNRDVIDSALSNTGSLLNSSA